MPDVRHTTIGLRKKSLLVVDDSRQVQSLIVEIVSAVGFDPVVATTRKEAITLSDRQAFDVAVVDKRLVEYDEGNEDGLAILRHISKKNEGTYLILLTGYGAYKDSVELRKDVGEFTPMSKESATMEEEMRRVLTEAVDHQGATFIKGSSPRLFCGREDPGGWETRAKSLLKPAAGILGLINLLDQLSQTCTPLLERPADNGIQGTTVDATMTGLYWSRGTGTAVVVVLAKDRIPDEIPRLDTWPPGLVLREVKYRVKLDKLVGAIVIADGVDPREFTVERSYAL